MKGYTADKQSIRGFPFFYPAHLRWLIFILLPALFCLPPGACPENMGRSCAGARFIAAWRLSRWMAFILRLVPYSSMGAYPENCGGIFIFPLVPDSLRHWRLP
ncbi:hypothetical protein [Heyndrickxia coagulans]|uniref:hypothetical protein n=1 Tax=Heyndrickxia coagulans TaxID=1398 RepID=UPI0021648840|nr:hypothetical protein [Heyndrickxia coagulans]MDT9754889.1 hypothetical protein [Heyndrickxia coagulans]